MALYITGGRLYGLRWFRLSVRLLVACGGTLWRGDSLCGSLWRCMALYGDGGVSLALVVASCVCAASVRVVDGVPGGAPEGWGVQIGKAAPAGGLPPLAPKRLKTPENSANKKRPKEGEEHDNI